MALESDPGAQLTLVGGGTFTSELMITNVMNQLLTLDFDLKPVPDLADKWSVSADGKTYRFELNRAAKWHDGPPVTSADVEYSFNEIHCKYSSRKGAWCPNIDSVKADGDYAVVVTLKAPFSPFLTILGDPNTEAFIYPKHIYAGSDPTKNPANQSPIGSGPFKFKEWKKDVSVELVRNDNYFKPGLPYLDRIVGLVTPNDSSRKLAFQNGDVDFISSYTVPYDLLQSLRQDPRAQVVPHGLEAVSPVDLLLFNTKSQYLSDPRVRQAVAYTLDRNEIANKATFGQARAAASVIGSGIVTFFNDKFDVYKPDLPKANQLLDAAGFPRGSDGQRFKLRFVLRTGRTYEQLAMDVIKSQLAPVGIGLDIRSLDPASHAQAVYKQFDFDLTLQLFTTGPDPTIGLTPRYLSSAIGQSFANGMQYANSELDQIFGTEFKEVDPAKRKALWDRVQQIMMTDLPVLPILEVPNVNLTSAKFVDVITGPVGYVSGREKTYMKKP